MARATETENDLSPRDLAARAAWLSFVGGLTQDQIAGELGISRQRVQRLVARAASEGLIRVRIDHPIANCLELERRLKARFGLASAWVSPDAGKGSDPLGGLAAFAAPVIERIFLGERIRTIAVGTGRTLRMVVEHMQSIDGSHHKLVSLIGNVAPDGSASFYEVIMRLAEKTAAPHYQMSIPVVARSPEELELFRSLPHVRATRALATAADLAIVGIGQMGPDAPLLVDGFITPAEQAELAAAGAVGEMLGNIFDRDGVYLDHPINSRIVGVRVPTKGMSVLCIAGGATKLPPLRAALTGKLLSGLITDETTARALLSP
ncbi:sugar-binding transcriptional regulator [Rhizobiaceae bacterium BDR2-2]|uniref:Sugar-binding transcriptional regulator n=1 Tax=Ectorhizobium quercum TaxID=2965071 RepID=A0AAE3MYA6_9HYPH|nr:sugar-binding transcriptional regulator [Ectorhizobium quercum]MCX8997189.1 sugar-binding transcriptional regulator [Ectorhizobium quercum]